MPSTDVTVRGRNAKPRSRAGRPTRRQAEHRHRELLDCALEVFLDNGFDRSTIERIATAAGMAKRTIYGLYPDKSALFEAAVQRAVERWLVPIETLRAAETDDLEETLLAIARIRLAGITGPAGIALQRILNAEGNRFPRLFRLLYEQGTVPALTFITEVLTRHAEAGIVEIDDPEVVGSAFLSMTVGGPATGALWGVNWDPDDLDKRMRTYVRLFLDGVRPRN
ncbi:MULTISPECIES: TetR/AcrR family transcriptional regulator [Mycobacterium]|uniref:TetR family transcriptional regulator n=1 Tax=Mycobacterium syngnathidarum TaxID=1908205 RepID=A0A1S1KJZ2_9MYCO|nr:MULTISPECIES: TetR/AcrR family transcriptional regulator [Mycobacterium]MCG7611309.1 TetR/AcrR family transcriptional regulator [Mycobacterium sp. CnD-18-1]OHU07434.1 TetR family transcriptional regulator [Mycobacterium syngnathidarum]OLT95155.1 TetR family transcriptional regulator [Mycobacterium syngnathidarum]